MGNINIQDVINTYEFLKEAIKKYEKDISDTKSALEDNRIDYITRREYKDDIIEDQKQIDMLEIRLRDLEKYAALNNIVLENSEEKEESKRI